MYHIRRTDKKIEDLTILKKILKTTTFITIAMSSNNQPYLVSLSHGYDEDQNCIYFHCAQEGKKLEYLRANNMVWGQALLDLGYCSAENECTHLYASVHFSGKVTFLDDIDKKRQAMICMIMQLDKNPKWLITKLKTERLRKTAIGRIDIEYMTGKKSKEVEI